MKIIHSIRNHAFLFTLFLAAVITFTGMSSANAHSGSHVVCSLAKPCDPNTIKETDCKSTSFDCHPAECTAALARWGNALKHARGMNYTLTRKLVTAPMALGMTLIFDGVERSTWASIANGPEKYNVLQFCGDFQERQEALMNDTPPLLRIGGPGLTGLSKAFSSSQLRQFGKDFAAKILNAHFNGKSVDIVKVKGFTLNIKIDAVGDTSLNITRTP